MSDRVELSNASAWIIGMVALLSACSSEPGTTGSSGGATSGGAITSGGAQSGGATSGGAVSSGGATSGGAVSSGGAMSSGGAVTTGGATSTGGAATSGGTTTGGASSSSGGSSSGSGGASSSTGGSSAGTTGGGVSSGGAGGTLGGGGAATGGAPGGGAGGGGAFTLTSPNHADGAKFASKYTCADAGFDKSIMPELDWTAGPAGTKSYAITFIDTTLAPGNMNGYHWVIYNIPPTVQKLAEGLRDAATVNAKQSGAFLGPCPNFGAGGATKTDNYEFTLYALASDTVTLTGTGTAMVKDAQTKLEATHLASVKLKGTSDAKPP